MSRRAGRCRRDLALLVDRRVGGVEVLRLDPVVVEDPPGAEADGVATRVADRPQAAPEPVVVPAAQRDQAGGDQLRVAERARLEVLEEVLTVVGGEPEPERRPRRLLVEATVGRGTGGPVMASGVGQVPRHTTLGRGGAPRASGWRGLTSGGASDPGRRRRCSAVSTPPSGRRGTPHSAEKVKPVVLHEVRDDVAAFSASLEAFAGEDVVLQHERVPLLHLCAEDLLNAVGLLDGLDHPPTPLGLLFGGPLEPL